MQSTPAWRNRAKVASLCSRANLANPLPELLFDVSTKIFSDVSRSSSFIIPIGANSFSRGSATITDIMSWRLLAICRSFWYPEVKKSEIMKVTAFLIVTLLRYSRAQVMSVSRPRGLKYSNSRITLSTWVIPLWGGMNFSIRSVKSIRPTLSLFLIALNASTAPNSAASSFLVVLTVPKLPEALISTRSITVSSRSSTNLLT